MVLWELEDTGLRVDRRVRWRHARRLLRREQAIRREVGETPAVREAVGVRQQEAEGALGRLLAAKATELASANQARASWDEAAAAVRASRAAGDRSVSVKSLGKPPSVTRSSVYTTALGTARQKVAALRRPFNPGSHQQKAWLLYEVMGLPVQHNTGDDGKRAVTTDKGALARLARHQKVLESPAYQQTLHLLREYEHTNQLRTTFVAAPLVGGRLQTLYGLHRTATGRIASGADDDEKARDDVSGNMQNVPKELRDMVIPEEGCRLVQVDWSRVEWLLTFYFAGDEEGWERALGGEDQHRRLAASIFGVRYEEVTPDQRAHAKRGTHGLNYGMGPHKLADTMGISFAEARRVLEAFKAAFPRVAKWREDVVEEAVRQRYLETPFGWRRWFWSKDPPEMVAFKPSATGADMLKARLPEAAGVCRRFPGGRLLTTTHDSVLGEAREGEAPALCAALVTVFQKPFATLGGRSFPAEGKVGVNWRVVS